MNAYQWFAKNGDKVLAFLTAASGAADLDAKALGLDPHAVAIAVFCGTLATLAHTIFFPNAVIPQSK